MGIRRHCARSLWAVALIVGLGSCFGLPTYELVPYGQPQPGDVTVTPASAAVAGASDAASAWMGPGPGPSVPPRAQVDGSPVPASIPGVVTTTGKAINDGVTIKGDQGAGTAGPGSRGLLLDLYTDAVEEVEILTESNTDLLAALEMAEERGAEFERQLKDLQVAYDELGKAKQSVDQRSFDMAARLATAQIARLEAERALLEATLEWRRMSARNNAPLEPGATGSRTGSRTGSGGERMR